MTKFDMITRALERIEKRLVVLAEVKVKVDNLQWWHRKILGTVLASIVSAIIGLVLFFIK